MDFPFRVKRGELFKFKADAYKPQFMRILRGANYCNFDIDASLMNGHIVEVIEDGIVYSERDTIEVYVPAFQGQLPVYFIRLERL